MIALALVAARPHPAPAGLRRRAAARSAADREDPRHGVLRGLRPAVRPRRRRQLHGDRHRDAARLDRPDGGEPGRRRRWRRSASSCSSLTTLAVLQLTRVAAGNRRWSLQAVTALGVVWVLSWLFGAQLVSDAPIASTSAADLVVREVRAVQAGVDDPAVFADQIRHDRYRNTPGSELLTGLRGKDVLLVFVESYGKVAVAGLLVLAAGRRRGQQGDEAAEGRGLLRPERLAHLVDVRRPQLAGAFHDAVGNLGQQPAALRPARQDQAPDAQPGLQAGRLADGRRRAVEQPGLAGGNVVLRLRQALRPAQRRVPRPEVLLRLDARPVRLPGPAAPRAREGPPPAGLRGGRPRVEPRALEPHPRADRLERRRRRLDLQSPARGPGDARRALQPPRRGAHGLRAVRSSTR